MRYAEKWVHLWERSKNEQEKAMFNVLDVFAFAQGFGRDSRKNVSPV
jgi:hypothetical protein